MFGLVTIAQNTSAHYIWYNLMTGSTTSTAAIRQPLSNYPIEIENVTSTIMTCNVDPTPATETVSVSAGSVIGFQLKSESNNQVFHEGPAAIYLGKAPSTAASWNGSGANWFKIAEWGATFNPLVNFTDMGASQLTTTIPINTPSGEYLARIEQIGLHIPQAPQWYISCAQIKVTGGGLGNPPTVAIPGYVNASDPSLVVNIYDPVPTSYMVPGPAVWRG
ncbi:glycoside hydrolase [Lyophyllum atratum]|nr:glycoside hydrolase [Lyophyllum atratum]